MGFQLYSQPSHFLDGLSSNKFFTLEAYTEKLTSAEINSLDILASNIVTDNLLVSNLTALSAFIKLIDIHLYELSGFNVEGDVYIQGNFTASKTVSGENIDTKDGFKYRGTAQNGYFLKGDGTSFTPKLITFDDLPPGQALTHIDDSNIGLTFTGTPSSSLLSAVTVQVTWRDLLPLNRGGTNSTTGSITGSSTLNFQTTGNNTLNIISTAIDLFGSVTMFGNISGNNLNASFNTSSATGDYSHAQNKSFAFGNYSSSQGYNCKAIGDFSHAEGSTTTASSGASHAEGSSTQSSGIASHAEGSGTIASGDHSHAQGNFAQATGTTAHAQGEHTKAMGDNSHAAGVYAIAAHDRTWIWRGTNETSSSYVSTTRSDQFLVSAAGGAALHGNVGINNDNNNNALTVVGNTVLDSLTANSAIFNTLLTDSANISSLSVNSLTGQRIITTTVIHPSAVSNTRYTFLSLSEAEPNLGRPTDTGIYFLTGDMMGTRGWNRGLPELNLNRIKSIEIYTTYLSAISADIDKLYSTNTSISSLLVNSLTSTGSVVVKDVSASGNVASNSINTNSLNTTNSNISSLLVNAITATNISTASLSASDIIIANSIITNTLTALSASINVIDISLYELSGFNVTGNTSISGNLSILNQLDVGAKINAYGNLHSNKIFNLNNNALLDFTNNDKVIIERDTEFRNSTNTGYSNITANNIIASNSIYSATLSSTILDLSAVKITNETTLSQASVTATDLYVKVIINGQNKYLRLFDLS